MRPRILVAAVAALGALAVTASGLGAGAALSLKSPAFRSGAAIPDAYTCDGANRSPKLVWSAPPKGTKSMALIMDDPETAFGNITHWTGWAIKPKAGSLGAGKALPLEGATFAGTGYAGPCPPPGDDPHRYRFTLYALDRTIKLTAGASRAQLEAAIKGHVLGKAPLFGTYERG
jgi:Raf kinase inhibitor-like YbhB/YbcL family protein